MATSSPKSWRDYTTLAEDDLFEAIGLTPEQINQIEPLFNSVLAREKAASFSQGYNSPTIESPE